MDNKGYNHNSTGDNKCADLKKAKKSWHIPRPTLARSSNSQHSTNSNNSTQSARSGSLLLTAANLASIHTNQNQEDSNNNNNNINRKLTAAKNIEYYLEKNEKYFPLVAATVNNQKISNSNLKPISNEDEDAISMASSTHFTLVNVNSRPLVKRHTRGFCRRHQLTILVVTMSALITLGIVIAIVLLELRAQRQRHLS